MPLLIKRGRLGIHIRYEFAFKLDDHVFEAQLLFLQTPHPQLIDMRNIRKLGDGDIEITMCHAQLLELSTVAKCVGNYIVH